MKVRTGVFSLILLFSSVLFLQVVKLYTNCYRYSNVTSVPFVNIVTWDSYGILWQYYGLLITVLDKFYAKFNNLVPQFESESQRWPKEWYISGSHDGNELGHFYLSQNVFKSLRDIVQHFQHLILSRQTTSNLTFRNRSGDAGFTDSLDDDGTASSTGINEGSHLMKTVDCPKFEEVYELLKEPRDLTEVAEVAQTRKLVVQRPAVSIDELEVLPSDTDIIINNTRITQLSEYPLSSDQIEFILWENTVNMKLKPLLTDYSTELTTELKDMIEEFEFSVLRPHMDSSHQSFNDEFLQLQQLLSGINRRDQERYHSYITRPSLRRVFYNISQHIQSYNDDTIQKLELFEGNTLRNLEDFQRYKLTLFEEWGDSIITEWSERLGINDITGTSSSSFDLETWRKFVQMKSRVIQAREALVRHKPDLLPLRGYIRMNTIRLNETIVALNSRLRACIEEAREGFTRREQEENSIDAQLLGSIEQEIENRTPSLDW